MCCDGAEESERQRSIRHDHARDTGVVLVWAVRRVCNELLDAACAVPPALAPSEHAPMRDSVSRSALLAGMIVCAWVRVVPAYLRTRGLAPMSAGMLLFHHLAATLHVIRRYV